MPNRLQATKLTLPVPSPWKRTLVSTVILNLDQFVLGLSKNLIW